MLRGYFSPAGRGDGVHERSDIGCYRVVRRLSHGEHSEVLLARAHGPHGFQRTVVLKRLTGACARDPQWLARLAAEAIAYARLSHSAIVRLYDFVEVEGTPTLVLEYVPGISLETLVQAKRARGERLGDPEVMYIGARVFAALAAAHGARHAETGEFSPVIHRDVSPGNVLVSTHGEVKLGDFGIARVAGVTDDTPSGTLLGTYGYMAPEQIVGDPITVRADVYGAALLMWELFAGKHAFERDSLPELELLQAMAAPHIPPIERLRPDLPSAVCEALGRALRANADERIGARDMLDVLRVHVPSAEARSALADDLARARRPASTIPDAPRAWTEYAAAIDPDATSDGGLSPMNDPALVLSTPSASASVSSRHPSDTPTALAVPSTLAAMTIPGPPTRPHRPTMLATTVAAALVLAGIAAVTVTSRGSGSAGSASTTALRSGASLGLSPNATRAATSSRSESDLPIPDDMGVLETPASMVGHRVFVDGVVRGVGGDRIRVRCGGHVVRLGSSGRFQSIDVPCRGIVAVER
jgi:serine/threonine-protein kinase